MAEAPLVVLRHPEKDITVPEEILMACSPVLGGILRDAAEPEEGGNKILTIDDVSLEVLEAFVGLVTINSYAPTDPTLKTEKIVKQAKLLMPLIHKYDCRGLLMRLQEAVNTKPAEPSILAVLEYETDSDWMQANSIDCLAAHLFSSGRSDAEKITKKSILEGLPQSVVVSLLMHIMTKAKLEGYSEGLRIIDHQSGVPCTPAKSVIRSD